MSDSNLGPACAYGSRAVLPADSLARSVILANDCADYLECIGMTAGQSRAEYLRAAAEDYCQHCDIAPNSIHDSEWNARAVAVIDSVYLYMRRHVFACVQVMRRRNADSRKHGATRARVLRHRAAFAAMSDSDLCETLRVLTEHGLARDSVPAAIAAGILRTEVRLRVRHGFERRAILESRA
jgi:hypothetical protein